MPPPLRTVDPRPNDGRPALSRALRSDYCLSRSRAYGAPVPPWIGPPSSPPWFWPVVPSAEVDELPGSQPSLPFPRPALHFCF
jgi:hypothetical protein